MCTCVKEMEEYGSCGAKWGQQGAPHGCWKGEGKEKYLGGIGMWWGEKKSPIRIWLPLSVFPVLAVFENPITIVVNKIF